MTKKQVIGALAPFPDNMEVYFGEKNTDFAFALVNSVYTKEIRFQENPDFKGKVHAKDTVIILDDE